MGAGLRSSAVLTFITFLYLLAGVSALKNTFSQRRNSFGDSLADRQYEAKLLPARQSSNISPVQQNLQVAPPVPIIQISESLILNAVNSSAAKQKRSLDSLMPGSSSSTFNPLFRRDAELCGPGSPCPDGSCCSNSGTCGWGPTYCGSGNCTSNCDSTAMCGRYSEGGSVKCGMNICCSYYGWCGTDELHCGNPDPNGLTPCQEDFGLCKIIPPPTCSSGSSTSGRSIGYYQASNVRSRACNTISPAQIVSTNFTHLNFAFASIDPSSFTITPADPADVPLYTQFTALKTSTLQTWIAIGGFDFSDVGPTHTTWSDLTSTQANRAAFISSLQAFMAQYGFQGVDLDWEYPATSDRGGQPADTENYVALVKEMRAAFGTQYGISLTLAPDYWYLRGFDAISMQPYVDWFGFMAYDLHGAWDANNPTLGALVRGQTDIREISNDTLPLWFDGLNPAKINFGLAYYGRGYTLTDPACDYLGCAFTGPSNPGPCTNFAGVMSLTEINQVIEKQDITPALIPGAMMKQISWGNQWIGYDDDETIALKKAWANGYCFGGSMVWSVDFNSGIGSGLVPDVNVTTNGMCGVSNGDTVCGNWTAGGCCSASGYCGDTIGHCGEGCQSGPCLATIPTSDGSCGVSPGGTVTFCGNWPSGNCCSSSGYCGNDTAHCGQGCQSGSCLSTVPTTDGTCGVSPGGTTVTCDGWSSGTCCSSHGYCGSDSDHCGAGCQSGPCTNGTSTSKGGSGDPPVPFTETEIGSSTFTIGNQGVSDLVALLNSTCGSNGCDATPQDISYKTGQENQLLTQTFTLTITGNYGETDFKGAMIDVIEAVLQKAITCSTVGYLVPFPCNAETDKAGGCLHETLQDCQVPTYIQVTTYDSAHGGDQMAQMTLLGSNDNKAFNCDDFTETIENSTSGLGVEGLDTILGAVKLICQIADLNGS